VIPDPHSTDSTGTSAWQASDSHPPTQASDSHPATPTPGSSSATGVASVQQRAAQIADERPDAAVGAAFAGGFLLALILKRLAR
jgi:hypothetical protein